MAIAGCGHDEAHGAGRLRIWLVGIGFLGVTMAIALDASFQLWSWPTWVPNDAGREIGGALVAGAIVGAVLHAMAETSERRRQAREKTLHEESMERAAEAEATDRRHRLAVEIAMRKDLSGLVLAGHDLQGVVLTHRDLREVDLSRADLSGADLSGANLSGAQLYGAKLENCDLFAANLSDANLGDASLRGSDIGEARFTNVALGLVDLDQVRWLPNRPPHLPEGYDLPQNQWADHYDDDLALIDLPAAGSAQVNKVSPHRHE